MDLDHEARRLIGELLRRLDSDDDGVVLRAARRIVAVLDYAGLDLNDLAGEVEHAGSATVKRMRATSE
jgi:hypothetical protein